MILDEICLAVARGLVDERQVADVVAQAPAGDVPRADRPRRHAGR